MKIQNKRFSTIPSKKKAASPSSTDGAFRTLLQQHIEETKQVTDIHVAADKPETHQGHLAWDMAEKAADLLDEAMQQILKEGKPNPSLINDLQGLRGQLRLEPESQEMREIDALLAVENERLRGI